MNYTVTLPDTVDNDVNVTIEWMLDTTTIITTNTSDRVIISPVSSMRTPFISTMTFNPLIMTDVGQYSCQATADSSSQYISASQGISSMETIIVTGILTHQIAVVF